MELHYYKNVNNGEEFLTWEYYTYDKVYYGEVITTIDEGWIKKNPPSFSSSQEAEAAHWFSKSNQEDMYMIEQELLYCQKHLDEIKKDIIRSEPNNIKILEKYNKANKS